MIKRIHVNRHHIAANKKGAMLAPFTVKTYKNNHTGYRVRIVGDCQLVYQPDKPLKCGAVAWIETESPVFVDGALIE